MHRSGPTGTRSRMTRPSRAAAVPVAQTAPPVLAVHEPSLETLRAIRRTPWLLYEGVSQSSPSQTPSSLAADVEPVAASDARDAAALWLAQPTEAVTASRPHAAPTVNLALLIVAARASASSSVDKVPNGGDHHVGRFLDEPVARASNDLPPDVGRDELGLLDEEGAARLLTRQDEHRHGKGRAAERGEVLGIALEVTEVLEARAHGAGLRVRSCVEPTIYLGHRALPVGREVVPEVLEIDALPAFHQRQRHLAMKVEVPQIAQEPHVLPIADAWQQGVQQDDPLRSLRELGGIGIRHHQPDVVADDADAIELQRSCQLMDVDRHRLLVVAGRRLGRASCATQIRHDDGVTRGERRHARAPHVAGFGVAVEQHHCAPLATDAIAQPDAVDLREALGESTEPGAVLLTCDHVIGPFREGS